MITHKDYRDGSITLELEIKGEGLVFRTRCVREQVVRQILDLCGDARSQEVLTPSTRYKLEKWSQPFGVVVTAVCWNLDEVRRGLAVERGINLRVPVYVLSPRRGSVTYGTWRIWGLNADDTIAGNYLEEKPGIIPLMLRGLWRLQWARYPELAQLSAELSMAQKVSS